MKSLDMREVDAKPRLEDFEDYTDFIDALIQWHLRARPKIPPPRRPIIWTWILAVVALGIFPPWATRYSAGKYGFLFLPPNSATHVDLSRLSVQWLLVTLVSAGAHFAWPG